MCGGLVDFPVLSPYTVLIMTITQTVAKILQGEINPQDLVAASLQKIEENRHLNAIIELNPEILAEAAALSSPSAKPPAGSAPGKGPLFGIPILLKDNINTAGRMHTSAGSLALAEHMAREDAAALTRLREAGAIILGKANMTEFANYMTYTKENPMPNGYSSRGGRTMHPTHADADPSGSSTGSAVAVAAGLCAAAIGSETYGSIVSPAQCCGVVGIKPSDGLVSKEGVLPISFTLDTLGPFASSVEDAALVLGVLAGREYPLTGQTKPWRIGICRKGRTPKGRDAEYHAANEGLIDAMKGLGFTCIELEDHGIDESFVFPIMRYEFKHALNTYLASSLSPHSRNHGVPQTLDEIIQWNEGHAEAALKYGQSLLIEANEVDDTWSRADEYQNALAQREEAIKSMLKFLDEKEVDILFMAKAEVGLAAALGFPSMSIPIGKTSWGLPIGCCFIARPFQEETLLRVVKAVEGAIL